MNISIGGATWENCIDNSGVATLRCIPVVISNLANAAIVLSGLVAVFMIILGGYKYLSSQGDPGKLDSAKKTLIWAIVGLFIIAFSYYILSLVSNLTGVKQIPH